MIPAHKRKSNQVDELLNRAAALGDDNFLVANICGHLCVLLSGVLELALKEIIGGFAKAKSHHDVGALAVAYLEQLQNPRPEKIEELFGLFGGKRGENLKKFWTGEVRDAIGSVVGNRHLIAHGRDTNISLTRIRAWNRCCQNFCDFLLQEFQV